MLRAERESQEIVASQIMKHFSIENTVMINHEKFCPASSFRYCFHNVVVCKIFHGRTRTVTPYLIIK